jgi:hypothetical protein
MPENIRKDPKTGILWVDLPPEPVGQAVRFHGPAFKESREAKFARAVKILGALRAARIDLNLSPDAAILNVIEAHL